jgi:hypothetical protein
MPITDAQMAALLAFLTGDPDGTTQLAYQLGEEGLVGYQHLANAALSLLAGRRFPMYVKANLVQYVASVRAERVADGEEYDFDPIVGETVLRYSLGKEVPPQDPEERFRAVIALLDALAGSELATEADPDSLLAEARELADQWLIDKQHSGLLGYVRNAFAANPYIRAVF